MDGSLVTALIALVLCASTIAALADARVAFRFGAGEGLCGVSNDAALANNSFAARVKEESSTWRAGSDLGVPAGDDYAAFLTTENPRGCRIGTPIC